VTRRIGSLQITLTSSSEDPSRGEFLGKEGSKDARQGSRLNVCSKREKLRGSKRGITGGKGFAVKLWLYRGLSER